MSFHDLPAELRELNQWVVWRYEDSGGDKPTKVPYNPRTGRHASVDDPASWVPFEYAVNAVAEHPDAYAGIGFVFTDRDEFTGIDLDDPHGDQETIERQQNIYVKMGSYSERSPSGKGLHIIVRARVPHGRKRSFVEVYSSGRFFTMTGDVYYNAPIAEQNQLVNILWAEMGVSATPNFYAGDFTEHNGDQEIYDTASRAKNGDLFTALWNGDTTGYSSPSEADFALIDIIAFYTKHKIQIKRLFLASKLGEREKYTKANASRQSTLIGYMINKSFDRMLPPIDLSGILDQFNAAVASRETGAQPLPEGADLNGSVAPQRAVGSDLPPVSFDGFDLNVWRNNRPPGIMGMLVDYIYEAAPRPVYEIAVAGAIGLLSGIGGRAFNVSATGLNHYVMLLAATGTGKEAISSGISKLIAEVVTATNVKSVAEFVGPSEIASGQALLKHLAERSTPCFVSVVGEFGLRLQLMSHPNASSSEVALRRVMLNLYNKSGAGDTERGSIYSDKKNNTPDINAPSFSLLGESTPETFYRALDEESVIQGLLPRFLIIEYDGIRVPLNLGHMTARPSKPLIDAIAQLAINCHENMSKGRCTLIAETPEATTLLSHINTNADNQINHTTREILRHLWNRVHIKTYKLAGLLAVAYNFYEPVIDKLMVEWAHSLVMTDTLRLLRKFDAGQMGTATSEDTKQIDELQKACNNWLTGGVEVAFAYKTPSNLHGAKIIPHSYLSRKLSAVACFRRDKRGSTPALKATIQAAMESGLLKEVPPPQLREQFKYEGRAYAVVDMAWALGDNG